MKCTVTSFAVLALDLDDTLYLERDFVESGFRATSQFLSHHESISADELFSFMWRLFESGARGEIFNLTLSNFNLLEDNGLVSELIAFYRSHRPDIKLCPDAEHFFSSLEGKCALGLITDGWPKTQHQKIDALGIEFFFEKIIITDEWSEKYRKPHLRAFVETESSFEVPGYRCVYLADNPHKDFIAPKERGWLTVRVRRHGGLYEEVFLDEAHEAHHIVRNLNEALKVIRSV
jgi:putative hydrolase of the HAD superfamily